MAGTSSTQNQKTRTISTSWINPGVFPERSSSKANSLGPDVLCNPGERAGQKIAHSASQSPGKTRILVQIPALIECFRGWHRGGGNFTSCLRFSGSLFHAAKRQGRILAVWILAAKLPNSDLNFGPQNSPGICPEKFPSDFCRRLLMQQNAPFLT